MPCWRASVRELAERRQRLAAAHRISVRFPIAATPPTTGSSRPGRAGGSPAPSPGRRPRRRQVRPPSTDVAPTPGAAASNLCSECSCGDHDRGVSRSTPARALATVAAWTTSPPKITVRVVRVFTRDGGGGNHLGIHDGSACRRRRCRSIATDARLLRDDLHRRARRRRRRRRPHLHAGRRAAVRRAPARRRDVAPRHARGRRRASLRHRRRRRAPHRRRRRRASRWPTSRRSSATTAPGTRSPRGSPRCRSPTRSIGSPARDAVAAYELADRPDHRLVWARGDGGDDDIVRARFFAPGMGVVEDPATGSAAVALAAVLRHEGDDIGRADDPPGRRDRQPVAHRPVVDRPRHRDRRCGRRRRTRGRSAPGAAREPGADEHQHETGDRQGGDVLVAEHDAEHEGDDGDEVADHRATRRPDPTEQRPGGDERQPGARARRGRRRRPPASTPATSPAHRPGRTAR